MTQTPPSSSHTCGYSRWERCGNVDRYEEMAKRGHCPHIRRIRLGIPTLDFYAVMDSQCHVNQPDLGEQTCNKPESSDLRLFVRYGRRNRNPMSVTVTCTLTTFAPHLLDFVGSTQASEGRLSATQKLRIMRNGDQSTPIQPECAETVVEVIKTPSHKESIADIRLHLSVHQSVPSQLKHKTIGSMQIAIPDKNEIPETVSKKSDERVETPPVKPSRTVEVFFSYASKDAAIRKRLDDHMTLMKQQGIVKNYYDGEIIPGQEWDKEIKAHLESSEIILLLVSVDFMASGYINNVELKHAMDRHRAGTARVIPILIDDCDTKGAIFAGLQSLPSDGKSIKGSGKPRNTVLTSVIEELRKSIADWVEKHPTRPT